MTVVSHPIVFFSENFAAQKDNGLESDLLKQFDILLSFPRKYLLSTIFLSCDATVKTSSEV